jgi:hypothetical protein
MEYFLTQVEYDIVNPFMWGTISSSFFSICHYFTRSGKTKNYINFIHLGFCGSFIVPTIVFALRGIMEFNKNGFMCSCHWFRFRLNYFCIGTLLPLIYTAWSNHKSITREEVEDKQTETT